MSIIYVLKILSKSTDAETDDRQKKKRGYKNDNRTMTCNDSNHLKLLKIFQNLNLYVSLSFRVRGIKIIIKQYLISSRKRIIIIKFLSSKESCH